MIDFETLGTNPDAVILTMGIVKFNPLGSGVSDRLELRPTIDDQVSLYNRTIDDNTVTWWGQQSSEAQNEAMGDHDRTSFKDCMEKLYKFCWNQDSVWSNGSTFDIMLAESAWRSLDMAVPWKFWTIRDCRTIYELAGVSLKDGKAVVSHRAVDDAEKQALLVQKSYKIFKDLGLTHFK